MHFYKRKGASKRASFFFMFIANHITHSSNNQVHFQEQKQLGNKFGLTDNGSCSYGESRRKAKVKSPKLKCSLYEVIVTSFQSKSLVCQAISYIRIGQQVSKGHIHCLLQYHIHIYIFGKKHIFFQENAKIHMWFWKLHTKTVKDVYLIL